MRRRRRSRETLGVSLFPFLAVLICTLGVLIVLLVLAVRSADVQAENTKANEQKKQQDELKELNGQYEVRLAQIEGLSQIRPEAAKRLSDARSHRGYLEEEIRQLKQRAQKIGDELLALEHQPPSITNETQPDDRVNDVKQQVVLAQQKLAEKRSQAKQNGPVTYSIVPHAGSGGTFRRPIFVECTADELVIQPLGIRLAKSEFAPPLENGNMLDSALLAIREYWERFDLSGKDGSPYPLLVVRPDGAETYVVARHAMKSWDEEFGYELIEAEKHLEFGEKDEQLAAIVQKVVDEARARQILIAARRVAVSRSGNFANDSMKASERATGLSASSPMGGFVSNSDYKTSAHQLAKNVAQAGGHDATEKKQSQDFGSEKSADDQANQQPGSTASVNGKSGESTSAVGNPYEDMSLAKERGENWALPSQTEGATGYVRPIRVVCSADELEIRSALGTEKVIPIAGNIESAIDPLVNEIWHQIESWGVSGARSYWKPELRVSVLQGGELNFEKLRGLLNESGLLLKESTQ